MTPTLVGALLPDPRILRASANTETAFPVPPPPLVGPAGVRGPHRQFLPAPPPPLPLYLAMTRVCCCPAWALLGATEGAGGGAGADGLYVCSGRH